MHLLWSLGEAPDLADKLEYDQLKRVAVRNHLVKVISEKRYSTFLRGLKKHEEGVALS